MARKKASPFRLPSKRQIRGMSSQSLLMLWNKGLSRTDAGKLGPVQAEILRRSKAGSWPVKRDS